jgi:estrogen-related receptor beta like 1
LPAANASE